MNNILMQNLIETTVLNAFNKSSKIQYTIEDNQIN
jgi:hypothetical protein